MTEHNEAKLSERHAPITSPHQNWGLIIGLGIVILGALVMAINLMGANLTVYEAKPNLSATTSIVANPLWVQIGRLAGLVVILSTGGWFLRLMLRQRQGSDQTYLKTHLQQAVSYTQKIEEILKTSANGHEQQLLTQIHTWWQMIETMAQTLADLSQNDHIIQHDLVHLPGAITDLEQQLAAETSPLLQADLQQMLVQRQNQQVSLEQLQITRRRAEIQIERTIAVLGTIYSQLLTYRSTYHVVDYQHLADNVAEEVQHLQDYLEALQEVKGSRSPHY
ncbi:hypothetical protein ACFLXQ_08310 [Chloroflexota bacterium]